jgi:hypothetical protein
MGVLSRFERLRKSGGKKGMRVGGAVVEIIGPADDVVNQVADAIERHEREAAARARSRPDGNTLRLDSTQEITVVGRPAFVVNALGDRGKTAPAKLKNQILRVRRDDPDAPLVVLLDETDAEAVRAAREAGATEFFGRAAASNPVALEWRISSALERAWGTGPAAMRTRAKTSSRLGLTVGAPTEPAPAEVRKALARVEAGLKRRASPEKALARAATLERVDLPELRDKQSGRLHANRVAERLGVSVNRLAPVAGVSQQALSKRPDSPRAQKGLAAVARVLAALDDLGLAKDAKMWLNAPHRGLADETPLAVMLQGRAEEVARMLERAVEAVPA